MSSLSDNPEFVRQVRERIKETSRIPWWTARAIAALVVVSTVVAAALLFFHAIPFVPNTAAIASNCPSETIVGNATVTASSGWTYFGCTTTSGAVKVNQAGASVLMTVKLTAPYTDLYLIPSPGGIPSGYGSCTAFPGSAQLPSSGGTVVLPAVGTYFYCADYANMNATGLPGFTVSWYP